MIKIIVENKLNESISGGMTKVYHAFGSKMKNATREEVLSVVRSIATGGFKTTPDGGIESGLAGEGIYAVYDPKDLNSDPDIDFGNHVIEFAVQLSDFLILDYSEAKKVYKDYTLEGQFKALRLPMGTNVADIDAGRSYLHEPPFHHDKQSLSHVSISDDERAKKRTSLGRKGKPYFGGDEDYDIPLLFSITDNLNKKGQPTEAVASELSQIEAIRSRIKGIIYTGHSGKSLVGYDPSRFKVTGWSYNGKDIKGGKKPQKLQESKIIRVKVI